MWYRVSRVCEVKPRSCDRPRCDILFGVVPDTLPLMQAWKVLPGTWRRLHRVALVITPDAGGMWEGDRWDVHEALIRVIGRTCCGREGLLVMPGVASRLGLERCRHCARIARVSADRRGIPGNGEACGPADAWQVAPTRALAHPLRR